MRPSLIQTPVIWPSSNLPQGWAQYGAYHYPQGRMPAPLALISPYGPVGTLALNALFKDKFRVGTMDEKIRDNADMNGLSHFFHYFSSVSFVRYHPM